MGQWIRFRLGFVYISFVAFFILIGFRLVELQVWKHSTLENLAARQFQKTSKKTLFRLPIFDRNGEELAVSMPSVSVFARPKLIKARRKTATILAKHLGGTPQKWLQKLDPKKSFIWVQRQLSEEISKKLISMNLPGIFVEPENHRFYPNGTTAGQLLGFTDIDGNGISGVELELNQELLETQARISVPRDGKGNPSYLEKTNSEEVSREGIRLTIDRRIQHVLEEELEAAEASTNAKGVMGIVMDPHTGEIFAMAQRPIFDPNHAREFPASRATNIWLSHLYEPGSTLKTIFAAEAIQNGFLKPETGIDCEGGKIRIGNRTISEAEMDHHFNTIPLSQVIQVSSNVGAVKVAQRLGVERVRSTLEKFGLTTKTGISLPGEVSGTAKGDDFWKPIFLATVGFGQGISVTPLQMVSAYAPFANGGYLVRPQIISSNFLPSDRLHHQKHILSPATVSAMKDILVGATEGKKATGVKAAIPGIRVAGKTGTAQKYEAGSGYENKKYFSSFIGFLPADKPELLIGVMVDEPKNTYYASQTAAPLFKRVAERSLQILDRVPKQVLSKNSAIVGPSEESKPVENPEIRVSSEGKWFMPNLRGLSMREALQVLGEHLPNVKIAGDGFLDSQSPESGSVISPETHVNLHFSPNS